MVGGGTLSNRIEYIDAMRGFTIILVVMTHVSTFVLMQTFGYTINYTFSLFRMPLFFFVSGFVLYKSGRMWNRTEVSQFLKKKIPVQVLSPLIFMMVIAKVFQDDFQSMLFGHFKGGYWFTFTLFEYFVIYILVQQALRLVRNNEWLKDALLLLAGLVVSGAVLLFVKAHRSEIDTGVVGLLGVSQGSYFMFFVIGSLVRKHYKTVEPLLDNKYTVAVLLSAFIILCLFSEWYYVLGTLYTKSAGLIGVFLVLSVFHKYRNELGKTTKVGYVLQYVGRRTLDIYLIHYFFVWSNLKVLFPDFGALQSPFAEFILSFMVAVVIIACSLLVSAVIRTSPLMAHFLFGQKYSK